MTSMRRAATAATCCLALMGGGGAAAGPPEITTATVLAIGRWVAAVKDHKPGLHDAAVNDVSGLSFDARKTLNVGMPLFLSALMSRGGVIRTNGDGEKDLVQLARETRQSPGPVAFLKRAAVLHSDAAISGERPIEPVGAPAVPASVAAKSPLLTNHKLVADRDGEILGEEAANWNWPFARSRLDLIPPSPGDDPFVGAWYHATAAYMLSEGLHGEATPHLARAAAVLPDDARILFDRACYAETLGLPQTQVLLSDADVVALLAQRSGRRIGLPRLRVSNLGIPLAEVTNAEAEELFRRALRAEPSLVEARVRLARLLELRKHHQEAAVELNAALAAKPTGVLAYYAHLFAGRAAQGLGRIGDAAAQYRAAGALFPGAQSALLAQSQAALAGSDVPATLAPIQHLDMSSSASDPWWYYHLGPGRAAHALLAEMWSTVPKV